MGRFEIALGRSKTEDKTDYWFDQALLQDIVKTLNESHANQAVIEQYRTLNELNPSNLYIPIEFPPRTLRGSEDEISLYISEIQENVISCILSFINRPGFPARQNPNSDYSPSVYRRDMLTFAVRLPRRSGNTIIAERLFRMFSSSILLVGSEEMRRNIRENNFHNLDRRDFEDRVHSVHSRFLQGGRHDCQITIIDTASYMSESIMARIYEFMDSDSYILLG